MKFENTRVFNFEGALRGMRNPLNSWAKSDSKFFTGCYFDPDIECDQVNIVANDWAEKQMESFMDLPEEKRDKKFEEIQEEALHWLYEEGTMPSYEEHHYDMALIGPNDMALAKRLIAGGPEHRKFLRQIMVSVDITAPLFLWKELDTYKVGTVANSTSTMHKLASTPITRECFEMDDFEDIAYSTEDNGDGKVEITTGDLADAFVEKLEKLRLKYLETKDKRYWKELVRWLPSGWLQTRTVTMNYENLRSIYHQRENHKLTEWYQFCTWVESLPYAADFIIA